MDKKTKDNDEPEVSRELLPYIEFLRLLRELLRDAKEEDDADGRV